MNSPARRKKGRIYETEIFPRRKMGSSQLPSIPGSQRIIKGWKSAPSIFLAATMKVNRFPKSNHSIFGVGIGIGVGFMLASARTSDG
jgi:hypothetical protein